MANLTITVPDETLHLARIRAAENGTSVNAFLRDQLEDFVGSEKERALERLLTFEPQPTGPREPYVWNREEIYRERLDKISPR